MITKKHSASLEFLGRALDMLRWGSETWKDAAQEDKGAIFVPTFIAGVHALYLEAYMDVSVPSVRLLV